MGEQSEQEESKTRGNPGKFHWLISIGNTKNYTGREFDEIWATAPLANQHRREVESGLELLGDFARLGDVRPGAELQAVQVAG